MINMEKHIQDIADTHGITFEKATESVCSSLEGAYKDEDIKVFYKAGEFKAMRKISLTELLDKMPTLEECLEQARQFKERIENVNDTMQNL